MKRHPPQVRFGHRTVETRKVSVFRRTLLAWWRGAKREFPWRHARASRYHQIVSEVLLQRTRAETVAAFWPIFITRFPSWGAIAASDVLELEEVLRPIGLAKQRAPRLHALAKAMIKKRGRFPAKREEIEKLPGIGQYIANAVFTFCHGASHPLLDVNMARVVERYFGPRQLADIRYDPYLQRLASHLVLHKNGISLNWGMLDFAALVCKARKPLCSTCPLNHLCLYKEKTNGTDK